MPKPPKASARFAFIKRKTFPFQTVRLCLTFKGKRLYYTDESYNWYGLDLTQFNSDGSLNLQPNNPDKKAYEDDSKGLLSMAQSAIMIADEADKRGVWEQITSKDFADLLEHMGEHRAIIEDRKRGIFNDSQTISEQLYEWRWQRVGKGKA